MDTFSFDDITGDDLGELIRAGADVTPAAPAETPLRRAPLGGADDDGEPTVSDGKPAIFMCVGGSGIRVGLGANQRIARFVTEAGHSKAARQRAANLFVLGVDTWAHPSLLALGAGNWTVLPANPHGINDRVQGLWDVNEHFRRVWPTLNGRPYLPGDFVDGAGGDRTKARLAWLLAKFEGARGVTAMVESAVHQIENALGNAAVVRDDAFEIIIYIVRGVAGGSGSGLRDALGLELRDALPAHCRFIAVDILPDAAELKAQKADYPALRANGAMALAEAERMTRAESRLVPFYERDGVAGTIRGEANPFLFTYLFSAQNAFKLRLTREGQVEDLAGDCLATEAFLSSADQTADPNSQFRQALAALPEYNGRSWSYASGAVSELRYRPELAAGALGRRFAAAAIQARLSPAAARGTDAYGRGQSAADEFIATHRLAWRNRSLTVRLESAIAGEPALPPMPVLAEGQPDWDEARRDDVPAVVAGRVKAFDEWRDKRWLPATQLRGLAALTEVRGAPGQPAAGDLRMVLDQLLAGDDGWGLARGAGFVDRLQKRLRAERGAVMELIEGPDWKREPGPGGLKERVAKRRAGGARAVQMLQESFGPLGLWAARAKRAFEAQAFTPFAQGERHLITAQAARAVLTKLLDDLEALQSRHATLAAAFQTGAVNLDAGAGDALGDREQGGVLEERVLAELDLVAAAFADELTNARRTAVDAVIAGLMSGDGGVALLLRQAATAPDPDATIREGVVRLLRQAATAGTALFQPATASLDVWEALHRELRCRISQREINLPLQRALEAARRRARDGGRPDGDETWEAILVQTYAEQRLRICLNRAAPYWSLDDNARIEAPPPLERPFPLKLVGFDQGCYDAFLHRSGLPDFLPRVVADLEVRPKDRPGPYAVTIYAREGGVPLFYLNRELTRPLVAQAAVVGRARPVVTDARWSPVITEFDPPPATGAGSGLVPALPAAAAGGTEAGDGDVVMPRTNGHGPAVDRSAAGLAAGAGSREG